MNSTPTRGCRTKLTSPTSGREPSPVPTATGSCRSRLTGDWHRAGRASGFGRSSAPVRGRKGGCANSRSSGRRRSSRRARCRAATAPARTPTAGASSTAMPSRHRHETGVWASSSTPSSTRSGCSRRRRRVEPARSGCAATGHRGRRTTTAPRFRRCWRRSCPSGRPSISCRTSGFRTVTKRRSPDATEWTRGATSSPLDSFSATARASRSSARCWRATARPGGWTKRGRRPMGISPSRSTSC